jgi:Uma2 family endonuclease
MATDVKSRLITAEEFMEMDLGEGMHELFRGDIVELPWTTPLEGFVCAKIGAALVGYSRESGYGYALGNSVGVVTERNPDTVRGVDVCFYSEERLPRSECGDSYPPIPPDVCIEVVSTDDRDEEFARKVREYLTVGTLLVWVVYPARRSVVMHRPGQTGTITLGDADTIEDLAELPGFRCPVADFFL